MLSVECSEQAGVVIDEVDDFQTVKCKKCELKQDGLNADDHG